MDLSDEVSLKMKSAIRARLKELGIIWDRELPDYVMVLVANKKTKEQMEEDLHIFLGGHTPDFTSWLHNVLKKLEECTSKGTSKKKDEKKIKAKRRTSGEDELESKKLCSVESKHDSDSEVSSVSSQPSKDVRMTEISNLTDFYLDSSEKDIWDKRIESLDPYRNIEKEDRKPRERIQINWDEEKKPSENGNQPTRERSRSRRRSESRCRKSRSKSRNRSRSSSRLKDDQGVSVLRRLGKDSGKYRETSKTRERKPYRDAREFIRSRASQERNGLNTRKSKKGDMGYEKDRTSKSQLNENKDEKLPSLVKVTPRPVRPLSMQPSSNLILKAVADAQKSIAITSLPQPENKLGIDDVKKKSVVRKKKPIFKKMRGASFEPNISITLLNDRVSSTKPEILESENPFNGMNIDPERSPHHDGPEVPRFTISLQSDDDSIIPSDIDENELNGAEDTFIEVVEPSESQTVVEPMDTNGDSQMEVEGIPDYQAESLPRFDRSRLGPRVVPVIPDTDTVLSCLGEGITKTIVNENAFSEGSQTNSEDNDKLIKCKFWPSCEAGDTCRFYHPKTYCRTLPNCKFGQKCLYFHPPCKFGDKCLNVACPYTHNATAVPPVKGKVWTKVPLAPSNGQICMFYPNCTKPFCPFQHYAAPGCGIPCKYGSSCTKIGCEFDHPQSSKNPYKWTAQGPE